MKANLGFLESSLVLSEVQFWEKGRAQDTPEIAIQKTVLGVDLVALIKRQLVVKRLVLSEPQVRMRFDEEGGLSLKDLFRAPREKEEDSSSQEVREGRQPPSEVDEGGALEAKKNRWLAELEETKIERAKIRILLEKDELEILVDDLRIGVDELRFDPENLETLNEVRMKIAGDLDLVDQSQLKLVRLELEGELKGQLFDEETGGFEADVESDLRLGPGSFLNPQVKVIRRVWETAQEVENIGIRLGDLPHQFRFGRSQRLTGSYRDGKVELLEPLSIGAGPWALGIGSESWIETFSGQHELAIEFLLAEGTTHFLERYLEQLPKPLREVGAQRFVDDQQALWIVRSKGQLKDPQLDFLSQLPEVKALVNELEDRFEDEIEDLRDRAKEEVKGLLKGLFGGDE